MFNPVITYEKHDKNSVLVHAKGGLFGNNDMIIPMPENQFTNGMIHWLNDGQMVQDAFPTLNATQRDFLLTGMSEKQQSEMENEPK
jgi:hypothetical protein